MCASKRLPPFDIMASRATSHTLRPALAAWALDILVKPCLIITSARRNAESFLRRSNRCAGERSAMPVHAGWVENGLIVVSRPIMMTIGRHPTWALTFSPSARAACTCARV